MVKLTKNQRLWLKKARDPKVKKIKGSLDSLKPNTFCIMGCGIEAMRESHKLEYDNNHYMKMLGFNSLRVNGGEFVNPVFYKDTKAFYFSIIDINDGSNATLPEMADIVEVNLKENNFRMFGSRKDES